MLSDLDIAQAARLRPIRAVAADLGLTDDDIELYGRHIAKIDPAVSAARYRALLGIEGTTVTEGVSFELGASAIVLTALNEHHRREGPCALELRGGASVDLDPAITHGVPIRLGT